jgi:hypothetical protein
VQTCQLQALQHLEDLILINNSKAIADEAEDWMAKSERQLQ